MKKLLYTLLCCLVCAFIACTNSSSYSPEDDIFHPTEGMNLVDSLKTDTVDVDRLDTIEKMDTVYIDRLDTVEKMDTVYIDRLDTVEKMDTVYIDRLDTIEKLDTVIINKIDTVHVKDSSEKIITDEHVYTDTLNMVFFGNSLLMGMYDAFGMAASAPENDYCSKVKQGLALKGVFANVQRVAAGGFEGLVSIEAQDAFLEQNLFSTINDETNIVVIQIGDNINTDGRLDVFDKTMDNLLERTKLRLSNNSNAKIYVVATWYTTDYTNNARAIIEESARKAEVTFIDISDLNVVENRSFVGQVVYLPWEKTFHLAYDDLKEIACSLYIDFTVSGFKGHSVITPETWSVDEEHKILTWTGHEYIVSNTGVASHPGDKGFQLIAERIVEYILE